VKSLLFIACQVFKKNYFTTESQNHLCCLYNMVIFLSLDLFCKFCLKKLFSRAILIRRHVQGFLFMKEQTWEIPKIDTGTSYTLFTTNVTDLGITGVKFWACYNAETQRHVLVMVWVRTCIHMITTHNLAGRLISLSVIHQISSHQATDLQWTQYNNRLYLIFLLYNDLQWLVKHLLHSDYWLKSMQLHWLCVICLFNEAASSSVAPNDRMINE
jgi:hypothetical protein